METSTTADAGEADPGEGCNLEQKRIKMNGKWGQSSEARKLKKPTQSNLRRRASRNVGQRDWSAKCQHLEMGPRKDHNDRGEYVFAE